MLIPKQHRQMLKSIDHPHMVWYPIADWAFGRRYKFRDGVVAYLFDGEIITLRKGTTLLWRKENPYG